MADLMQIHARTFSQHLGRLLHRRGADAAHQTRVAIRRLRATLEAMTPILRPSLRRVLISDLREMFRQIGVLRDAEVLAEQYRGTLAEAALAQDVTRLHLTLRKALKAGQAARLPRQIRKKFSGRRWRRAKGRDPVEGLAIRALGRAWAKARAHGDDLDAMAVAKQHELRKSLKVFRYMAEDFAPIWPPETTEPFLARLRILQEDLGFLNDLSLADAAGLPADPSRKAALLTQASVMWRALHATPPWWN